MDTSQGSVDKSQNFQDSKTERFQDAETITDICRGGERDCDDSEVLLISLLEERIPRYTLRADTRTTFAGYENEDWTTIRTPCFQGDFDPDLSVDLIEETLKYFIIGGARVSQITRTFDDSRALTMLLEEKERDLEISSELGKLLIARVRSLEKSIVRQKQENEKMKAQISDLRRELTLRDSLLRVHVEDFDSDSESEDDDRSITDCSSLKLTDVNVESVRKKVKVLQTENDRMASNFQRIEGQMEEGQERQDQLVATCIENLLQMNHSVLFLREELDARIESAARQQDEINSYAEQVLTLDAKMETLTEELRKVSRKLSDSEQQRQMANVEIDEWRRRYAECWDLLQSANEELKRLRNSQTKTSVIHRNYSCGTFATSPFVPMDSLASELHDSQRKDLFHYLGYSPSATRSHSRKVMDVAKTVSRAASLQRCTEGPTEGQTPLDGGGGRDGVDAEGESSCPIDDLMSDGDSLESQCGSLEHCSGDISDSELNDESCSEWSRNQRHLLGFNHLSLGQPGIPGSNDLEVALMRLNSPTMLSGPNVILRNCASLSDDTQSELDERRSRPSIASIPDQLSLSTDVKSRASSITNLSETSDIVFGKTKLPEKLQIVKPIEGSLTLNHWKALTVPNLHGILENRPGIQTKDQPADKLFHDESDLFSLGDYEEEEEEGEEDTSPSPSNPHAPNQESTCNGLGLEPRTISFNRNNLRFRGGVFQEQSVLNSASRRQEIGLNPRSDIVGNNHLQSFGDCEPRLLPDIVTSEKMAADLTETPLSFSPCCVM